MFNKTRKMVRGAEKVPHLTSRNPIDKDRVLLYNITELNVRLFGGNQRCVA